MLPPRTLSGEFDLDVGGRHVRLIELGPAHTPGDLIVWVPDARIALAADILFIGVTPIMWAGPVERWIAPLERLLDLGAERFVPGHGPVCGAEKVQRLIDYWRWLDSAARTHLDGGRSDAETTRELVSATTSPSAASPTGSLPSGPSSASARSTPTAGALPSCPARVS